MNAQLTDLCARFRLNTERAQSLLSRAGAARLDVRPRPDSWSAAECLVHLTMSTEMFLLAWRSAFASARAGGLLEKGPFRKDLVGTVMNWVLQPPARIRVKAPHSLQPVPAGDAVQAFLASQSQLLDAVSDAAGLALDRVKIAPVDPRIRYNVWAS